ncbi:MAG: hypothetical protein HZA91_12395 [Verrucomicrobia bacterium]|nr:hypothetical protein [Verrucomicrobiota bacterium]
MAQEPNNRMDDALKAYAKQRRQRAGEPFEMHPATRRMLQGEVARTLGKRAATARWDTLRLWWPRLAFGGAGVAVVAVAAVVMLQQAGKKPGGVAEMAKAEVQRGTDLRLADRAATREGSGKKLDEMLAGQPQVAMARPAPALEAGRVAGESAGKLKDTKVAAAALPPAAMPIRTPAPAEPAPAGQGGQSRMITAGVQNIAPLAQRMRFAQVPSVRDAEARKQPQVQQQVLASFQFEQSGDRVVIVDADGSTYEGQIQSTQAAPSHQDATAGRRVTLARAVPARAEAPAKEQPQPAKAVPQTGTAIAGGKFAEAATGQEQRQQQLFFTAAGTNRSLRQRVVITGELNLAGAVISSITAVASPPASFGAVLVASSNAPAAAAAAPAAPALFPQMPARVQGTFRVGDTPEVPLDAVRVGP